MLEIFDYIKERKESFTTAVNNNIGNKSTDRKVIRKLKAEMKEKQLYEYFTRQAGKIENQKTWAWLLRGNLKRETEAFLTATQNNAIKVDYFKAGIDNTL